MSKEKKKFWILIHTASWVVLDLPEAWFLRKPRTWVCGREQQHITGVQL